MSRRQLGAGVAVAVMREDGLVGGRAGVERDLLASCVAKRRSLFFGVADDDEDRRDERNVVDGSSCLLRARLDRGADDLDEVLARVEGVHVEPVADLSGHDGRGPCSHPPPGSGSRGSRSIPPEKKSVSEGERIEVARERRASLHPGRRGRSHGARARTRASAPPGDPTRWRTGARCAPSPACRGRAGSCRRDCSARSQAICAVTIGLRGNATATEVPTPTPPPAASVATAHGRNGLWPASVNQIAEKPEALRLAGERADVAQLPAESVGVEIHDCQSPIRRQPSSKCVGATRRRSEIVMSRS